MRAQYVYLLLYISPSVRCALLILESFLTITVK